MTDRCDVLVVGGGIAGLVAAAAASRAGTQVVLVDAHAVGGRARTTDQQGFRLNQGPHAVYRRGALMNAMKRLGVEVRGSVPPLGNAQAWFRGQRLALPTRNAEMARSRLLRMRSKLGAKRVFDALGKDNAARLRDVSLTQLLDDQKAPDDLRAFVEAIARVSTYANAPDLMSAEAFARQYALGGAGVLYLDDGWQQLVDSLADVARQSGAKILDRRAVLEVHQDASDWLVATDAGDLTAPALVLAAGLPAEATRLLGEDLGWVEAAGPAVRAACLDLGLGRPGEASFLLGIDEPYYLSTHSPPARLAPEGHQLVSLARYLQPEEHVPREECEEGLRAHARRAGIADDAVVTDRYLHEMVVAGGLPLASRGGFEGRPAVIVAQRQGLYLAGDWVGAEGLIGDAAAASGAAAAQAACARLEELGRVTDGADPVTDVFTRERPRLVGLAYRLLGSLTDAEDVVQEAWFRWERADHCVIERPEAWLTTVVSRIGLDVLRARQRDRADYVGPWLPEPLVEPQSDPADAAELSDTLTTGFLLVLEHLSPVERLVFLLADVFDEPFSSISAITGKSEQACRQIASRARRKLHGASRVPSTPLAEQRRIATTFALAALAGDRDTLFELLSPDVVVLSDGGKDHHAARRPVVGADRVARFVSNIARRIARASSVEPVLVNGAVGLLVRVDGRPVLTQEFEIRDGRITRISGVLNPAKLAAIERHVELV